MRGAFTILACWLVTCVCGAAVKSAIPIALLGTDEGVRDVMEEAQGALQDAASQAVERATDVLDEALPDVKKTLPSSDDALDDVPGAGEVFDDVPGAAAADVLDDGAPSLATQADDVIDDVLPESADEPLDDVRDDLPQSDDDNKTPDVNDDTRDDINDDTDRGERTDEALGDDLERDGLSSESTESSESMESESMESDEEYDPVATFMGMVKEFKDDVGDDLRDSDINDINDDKNDDDYDNVMRQLGGELKSIGITEDPEDFIEQTMEAREDAQEDAYDALLDMSGSSESRDDDYHRLLDDDVVEDMFGDDNDGLLDIGQAKQSASKPRTIYGRAKPRHNYYGYAANMINRMQANLAYDKAHTAGTCPLYPVSIDEDKVTITTQGGCSIVITLKGATVESVQTDGDNLTERERVARSVEVTYSSETED